MADQKIPTFPNVFMSWSATGVISAPEKLPNDLAWRVVMSGLKAAHDADS
jgi:hypothetical protein